MLHVKHTEYILIFYLHDSGSVFRKVQQDRRVSRLGWVAWVICVGHRVSHTYDEVK